MTTIRCPKCRTPGANFGVYGFAYMAENHEVQEIHTYFDEDIPFECCNCDYRGPREKFESDEPLCTRDEKIPTKPKGGKKK